MSAQGQRQILLVNTGAVISNPDEFSAACLKINIDPSAIRIKTVFKQLLDDRCRPFNNFTSSNLVRQTGIQLHNTWHKMT